MCPCDIHLFYQIYWNTFSTNNFFLVPTMLKPIITVRCLYDVATITSVIPFPSPFRDDGSDGRENDHSHSIRLPSGVSDAAASTAAANATADANATTAAAAANHDHFHRPDLRGEAKDLWF